MTTSIFVTVDGRNLASSDDLGKAIAQHLAMGQVFDRARLALEHAYEVGSRRWPQLSVPEEAFVEFVAERSPLETCSALQLEDLYFTCGCLRGPSAPVAAVFRAEFIPKLDYVLRNSRVATISSHDFHNHVLVHVLVAPSGETPRLAKYAGRGELRYWIGVVAGRLLADLARMSTADPATAESERLDVLPSPEDSPEAAYLRHFYRDQFEAALQEAFAELEPRDRDLLRFHVIDQMPTPTIAALFGIHRGTAARWLKEARQKLLWATQNRLVDRFEIPRGELDSLLRLVRSQLDLSVRRLLLPSS